MEKIPSKWTPPPATVPRPEARPKWDALEPPETPTIKRERDTVPPRESRDRVDGALLEDSLTDAQLRKLVVRNIAETQALKGSVDTLYEALMIHMQSDRAANDRCPMALQWLAVAISAAAMAMASWALLRTAPGSITPIGCAIAAEGSSWTRNTGE